MTGRRRGRSAGRFKWSGGRLAGQGVRYNPAPVGGRRSIGSSLFFTLVVFVASVSMADASELSVDKRSVAMDESLHAMVRLEGSFAKADSITLPLRNLTADGAPSTSAEFQFINGASFRSKTFTFTLHGNGPGPALVGPLVIRDEDGRTEMLPPVAVQVTPDVFAGSSDPARILAEELATGRDPVFLIAEPDRRTAWVGEQVVVTWYLYTALSLSDFHLIELPKLEDFWSEELEGRGEETRQVIIGRTVMQRAVLRRVALFPLRAGTLAVGSLKTVAAVMKRSREPFDPFGLFEGNMVEVRQHSAPIAIEARSLPPGVAVDAVGDFGMNCSRAIQRGGGPVVVDVTVSGGGNLRSAPPPRFERPFPGTVELENRPITVNATTGGLTMRRTWRFLLSPAAAGHLSVPPISMVIWRPLAGPQTLRCAGSELAVSLTQGNRSSGASERRPGSSATRLVSRDRTVAVVGVAALVILAAWFLRPKRKTSHGKSDVRSWLGSPRRAPRDLIAALDEIVHSARHDPRALRSAASDLGDAYRSLLSLLTMLEHDRQVEDADRELERRGREFFALL